MSIWHEIKNPEDLEISEDGKTIEVLFNSDRFGNFYVDIPIIFIKTLLKSQDENAPNK